MNPTQIQIKKDFVKVHIYILPKNPSNFFYFSKLENTAFYHHLN